MQKMSHMTIISYFCHFQDFETNLAISETA